MNVLYDDSAESLYTSKLSDRSVYEDRAEDSANLTNPSVFPKAGTTASDRYSDNYVQSLGGKGVNHLSSKLVLALLPPAGQFFRFEPDSEALSEITGDNPDARMKAVGLFSKQEHRVREEIKAQDIRIPMFRLMRLLVVTGCVLVEKEKKIGIRYYNLRDFVIERDGRGKPNLIILTEKVAPYDVKDKLSDTAKGMVSDDNSDMLDSYTKCIFDGKKWTVTQEVLGEEIWSMTYTEEKFPFQVLDWSLTVGEDYGRSYIDELKGDLTQYELLTKSISEGSAIASKAILFVNPLSSKGTRKRSVAQAKNGAVLTGSADDVTSFTLDKNYDFRTPAEVRQDFKRDIEASFLMERSIQRDAERVTAEEIRKLSQELETAFAGLYALISELLLKRLVLWIMDELKIDMAGTEVNVIVGVDALSRNAEAVKLDGFMGRVTNLGYQHRVSESEVLSRYASYEGVDPTGLLLDSKEVQKKQDDKAKAMMQEEASKAGGQQMVAGATQQGAVQ